MNEKGFFGRLFDLSFSRFIATTLIKVVYRVAMLVGAFLSVIAIGSGFALGQPVQGVIALVLAPLGFLVYLIVVRLYCEFFIVVFAMAEDLEDIRKGIERLSTPPGPREEKRDALVNALLEQWASKQVSEGGTPNQTSPSEPGGEKVK